MSKVVELKEEKAKKNGEYTSKQLIEDLSKSKSEIKAIVTVQIMDDETIIARWSNMNNTEAVGLLEVAKDQILKDMQGL
ncbi:hypothetical protein [Orenia marismortui]|uniref:Uncharacterized protein n=1 Tax=Orenia marismortui TaxID=46469 RepID=A0A4R8H214_9FIRM|nr:hypothetical protein [Orenia marismortui]TDX49114.1 hypothetical protein C7959_1208 [Orenia marismortui]